MEYELLGWPALAAHWHGCSLPLPEIWTISHQTFSDHVSVVCTRSDSHKVNSWRVHISTVTDGDTLCRYPGREPVDVLYKHKQLTLAEQIVRVHECLRKPARRIWFPINQWFLPRLWNKESWSSEAFIGSIPELFLNNLHPFSQNTVIFFCRGRTYTVHQWIFCGSTERKSRGPSES
jgi:hypothetical protein